MLRTIIDIFILSFIAYEIYEKVRLGIITIRSNKEANAFVKEVEEKHKYDEPFELIRVEK